MDVADPILSLIDKPKIAINFKQRMFPVEFVLVQISDNSIRNCTLSVRKKIKFTYNHATFV